jgi:hypothetical protein
MRLITRSFCKPAEIICPITRVLCQPAQNTCFPKIRVISGRPWFFSVSSVPSVVKGFDSGNPQAPESAKQPAQARTGAPAFALIQSDLCFARAFVFYAQQGWAFQRQGHFSVERVGLVAATGGFMLCGAVIRFEWRLALDGVGVGVGVGAPFSKM